MKKTLGLCVFGLLAVLSTAWGEPFRKHTFGVAPEIFRYEYREPSMGVKEEGFMYGADFFYVYHADPRANDWMLKLELLSAWGQADYSSDQTGSANSFGQFMLEPRVLLGYDIHTDEWTAYTLYGGFGYRYFNDDGSGKTTTTGDLGYERSLNYYYLPLGIEAVQDMRNDWLFSANLEFDWILSGKQDSSVDGVSPRLDMFRNSKNEGYGIRGGIKLTRRNPNFDVTFAPFIRYWDLNEGVDSRIVENGDGTGRVVSDPSHRSTELGGSVAFSF